MEDQEYLGVLISKQPNQDYFSFWASESGDCTEDLSLAEYFSCEKGQQIAANPENNCFWVSHTDLAKLKTCTLIKTVDISQDALKLFCDRLYSFIIKHSDVSFDEFANWGPFDPKYPSYEIVDKPIGQEQKVEWLEYEEDINSVPEEFRYIKTEWCNQRITNLDGDMFAGTLCYELPNGQFLKCFYSC